MIKGKSKIFIVTLLFMTMFLIMFSTNVEAYDVFGGRFSRGVGNTCYYVDSTASGYTTQINASANNWVVTGHGYNPIYMTAVSSTKGSHIDLYGRNNEFWPGEFGILGETMFYTSSSVRMYDITTNWFYAEIHLNLDTLATIEYNQRQGTITHEMGHAFGLKHSMDTNCIMCQYGYGRNVYLVDADSHNGINFLY